MIWPIGQPAGELHQMALRSRESWLTLAQHAGVWARPCGSIHLAHAVDEWAVLQEFHGAAGKLGYACDLLTPAQIHARTPGANPVNLLGGLWSPTEIGVNPRTAVPRIATWLHERHGVRFEFSTPVNGVESGRVFTATGSTEGADTIIVCGGSDSRTLFPELVRQSGARACKLQMLKTCAQPYGWALGPHLAGGLTLRHYRSFAICPSLPKVANRVAAQTPELDRFAIHVMASQNDAGEIILGDSHEYEDQIDPFDKALIENLILRELRRIIHLPTWEITQRWHGIYLKHPQDPIFEANPIPGVYLSTATGGAGMTMAFGLAERFWESSMGEVAA
jgi:FAD dependent oxidoreductase TIGR03364